MLQVLLNIWTEATALLVVNWFSGGDENGLNVVKNSLDGSLCRGLDSL